MTLPNGSVSNLLSAGIAAEQLGHLTAATRDYRAVLARQAKNVYALYDLGTVAQEQRRSTVAIDDYRRALVVDPVYRPALYNLAILLTPNQPKVAVAEYRRLEAIDPGDPNVEFNLGLLLIKSGQVTSGRSQILAALSKDPALVNRLPESVLRLTKR